MSTRRPSSNGKSSAQPVAESTARRQRRIQAEQDRHDQSGKAKKSHDKKKPVQAGARRQPGKLPAQHIAKPGRDCELALAPQFLAPDYRGSGKLEGVAAIVTGVDSGIGRAVACLDEDDDAAETRRCVEAEGRRCLLVAGDIRRPRFAQKVVARTMAAFGRLDVLVNNAAFQEHAESIEDSTEPRLEETFRTNIFGYFHMAQAALPHL